MRMILLLASAAALGAGGLRAASAATGESTIYSFTDGNDGGFPQSGLTYEYIGVSAEKGHVAVRLGAAGSLTEPRAGAALARP